MNNRIEKARAFVEACNTLLENGDSTSAGSLVACSSNGSGQVWTWEVEELYRSPINEDEEKIVSEIDRLLLLIANEIYKRVEATSQRLVYMPYVWYIVICLNKLGGKAPKELINKMIVKINELDIVDGRQVTTLTMLKSFLPVVSYFH